MLPLVHPALVHFPIAFVVLGGGSEVWGLLSGRETPRRWGASLVLVGLVCLVPTLATGYLAANTQILPEAAAERLGAHERAGWILLGLLLATQFWKAWGGGRVPDRLRWLYAAVMLSAVLVALLAAWLGGQMVHGGA